MDELLERTRRATLARVREVRRALGAVNDPEDRSLDAALRELHAIKGETAMAGLRLISKLAHALEALVIQRRSEEPLHLADAIDALHVLAEVLSTTPAERLVESCDIDGLLGEVLAASEPEPGAGARLQPNRQRDEPASPRQSGSDERTAPILETGWIQVDARRIEDLSRVVSDVAAELDGARAALAALGQDLDRAASVQAQALAERLETARSRVAQAEERAWNLRLVSVAPTLQDIADHVLALARRLDKQVTVAVNAHGVALERGVVQALREPLVHLARNAVDHGIEHAALRHDKPELGTIRFSAESHGSEISIVVEDDGAGLDIKRIRQRAVEVNLLAAERAPLLSRDEVLDLVFKRGFSQRDDVSEISGRGIGLAAVRGAVEGLGGAVRLSTSPGRGSRFELVLPAAVARERVLVVQAGGVPWAIPSRWVRLVVREPDALKSARRERSLRLQDGLVPVRALNAWLGAPREEETAAIVVEIAGRRTALLVGRIEAEVDLLRAPTDRLLAAAARVAASGTLDDGRVAFFPRWAEVLREALQLGEEDALPAPQKSSRPAAVLIVDDSPVIRDIVGEVLSAAGVQVTTAGDGKVALELIGRQTFDLVVSDIEMPRMNGLELLQKVRQQTEVLPVVMLTTRSKPEHRREAALLGANAYIAKSEFRGDTLMDVVRRFIDLPS